MYLHNLLCHDPLTYPSPPGIRSYGGVGLNFLVIVCFPYRQHHGRRPGQNLSCKRKITTLLSGHSRQEKKNNHLISSCLRSSSLQRTKTNRFIWIDFQNTSRHLRQNFDTDKLSLGPPLLHLFAKATLSKFIYHGSGIRHPRADNGVTS